jgi:pyrrolidone-carboxylate peptidase
LSKNIHFDTLSKEGKATDMNKQEIYGFAFGKTISANILYRMQNIDCCYLVFGTASIDGYLRFLTRNQPQYILGLGVYAGIDQDKIRIEEICTNKFRNDFLDCDTLKTYEINPFLKPGRLSKISRGIGNSYCNYISYQIVKLIDSGELKSRYTFIHVPKTLNCRNAIEEIDQQISDFKRTLSD